MTDETQTTEVPVQPESTDTVLTGTTETEPTQSTEEQQDFVTDEEILPTEDKTSEYSWVNDKFKGDDGNFDTDKAAKSYAELSKKLSDKNMIAPESADQYEITLSENTILNEQADTEIREAFKEMGIPSALAQPLVEMYEQRVGEAMQTINENAAPKFEASEAATSLKEDWGNDFEANVGNANKAITAFFDGDIGQHLELANNPAFAKFAAKIGSQMGEDSAPTNTQPRTTLTEMEVDELMQRDDYWDESSATYKAVQAYYGN